MSSTDKIWQSILEFLQQELTPVAISTWFDECSVVSIDENGLVLLVPSEFKRGVINLRFMPVLKNAASQIFSGEFDVTVVGPEELEASQKSKSSGTSGELTSDDFTFENFIVGPSNKFAHAAAIAVAEGQSKQYNPLFIYGESGLGKTHLLYAIQHEVRRRHPEYNIVFVRGNDFMNELIQAIQTGQNVSFREKFRTADLFLMDDIQIIAGKETTQEEFFQTFNTLHEAQKQIVFTSDRPPSAMTLLADRLRTRLESGLLADIQPPDYETRCAIIKNKSMQLNMILPEDVVAYIAENMTANVRQIEGSVKMLKARYELMEEPITVSTAIQAIKDLFKEKTSFVPTPDDIIEETAKYYGLTPKEIKGQSRTRNTTLARQIAMHQIRRLTILSLQDIGEVFEGRDHSTVLNSIRKVDTMMQESEEFSQIIRDITANINARGT